MIINQEKMELKLKESEEILRAILDSTADGILVVNKIGQITNINSKFVDMWHIPKDLLEERDDKKLWDYVLSQLKEPESILSKAEQLFLSSSNDFDTLYFKDGRIFDRFSCPLILDVQIQGRVWSFRDVTERRKSEQELKRIEWLLEPKSVQESLKIPDYGDLTELNKHNIILELVRKEVLNDIASDYLNLLETSTAIYEKNGDYALGMFSSGWCKFLDKASRKLCNTDDNTTALNCGKWLCHESCWNNSSKKSIDLKQLVDNECHGGLHIFATPILARNKIVGSINIGYGNPPSDDLKLRDIAEKYNVNIEELRKLSKSYESRPVWVINIAKKNLLTSASLIGEIIERKMIENDLKESKHELSERVKELTCLYELSKLVRSPVLSFEDIFKGTLNLIPSAWQFIDTTTARITYDGKEYKLGNFEETEWKLSTKVEINEKPLLIEVYYLENKPFLKEEHDLIRDIGIRLKVILEEKETQKRLRKSEEKYRTLFESSKDGIVFTNIEGKIIDCNQAYLDMLGYTLEEIKEYTYQQLTPEKWHEMEEEIVKNQLIERDYSDSYEKEYIRKDGTVFPVSLRFWLIKSEQGELIGFWGFIRDISKRIKAENLIKKELKKLKELDEIRKNLIIRASHEMRTPLIPVYNASQLLLTEFKDRMDSKVLELVEVINIGGKRLKKLVYDVLDASRIESNNLKLRLGKENLIKIIKEAIDDMKYLVSKRNLFLNSDLPFRIKIDVDNNRIKRVFTNLLSNAIKNTPPKGKIYIYVRECDDYVDICIRDSGVGLIEKEKQKIFKKFGKIERYGKGLDIDTEGSGLGLYLSNEIVRLHGGQIFVESQGRNKGAEFIVRLHKKIPI